VNLVEESNVNLLVESSDLFLKKLKETSDLQKCISTFETLEEGLGSAIEQFISKNLKKVIFFLADKFKFKYEELSPAEKKLADDLIAYKNTLQTNSEKYEKDRTPTGSLNRTIAQGIGKPTGISIK